MGRPKGMRSYKTRDKRLKRIQQSSDDDFRKFGLPKGDYHYRFVWGYMPIPSEATNAMPIQGEDPRMNKGVGVEPNLQEP